MLLLAAVPAAGQVLRFERLTQDDGLSQNVVNVISQDSFGFIWIGTQDGLNRFDGYEVRSFRPDGTAGSLGDGHVLALRPDGDGTMWIGTREGGLARWDAASETFQSWRHDPARSDTLSIDYVRSILQNPDGSFWIGTIEGLNHFDRRSGRMQRYLPDANDPRSVAMTDVGLLFRDSAGMVWASYRKGALDSIDANRNIRHRQAELDALGVTGSITTAANDRAGRTWLGTSTGQLLSWDPKTQQFARAGEVSAEAAIKSLLVDRAGALWIATRGQGLLRRDPTSGQLRTLRHDPSDPHSIPSDLVESLFEDRTGVLWVLSLIHI